MAAAAGRAGAGGRVGCATLLDSPAGCGAAGPDNQAASSGATLPASTLPIELGALDTLVGVVEAVDSADADADVVFVEVVLLVLTTTVVVVVVVVVTIEVVVVLTASAMCGV